MRVLKDKVFERVKAFNLVQMTHFVITRLESYYERKLLDAAHNRCTTRTVISKTWLTPSTAILDNIQVNKRSLCVSRVEINTWVLQCVNVSSITDSKFNTSTCHNFQKCICYQNYVGLLSALTHDLTYRGT